MTSHTDHIDHTPEALVSWLDQWLDELVTIGRAPLTIKTYRMSVRMWLRWLGDHHPEVTSEAHLERQHVAGWIRELTEGGRKSNTRRIRGLAVGAFLKYVTKDQDSGLSRNPVAELQLPSPSIPIVPIIQKQDLVILLASMNSGTFEDRRDTVVVRMLLDCGIRRAELASVNVDDIDLGNRVVLIHGKGGKDRLVPIGGDKTNLAIRKYLRIRATRPNASRPAFLLPARGPGVAQGQLTPDGLYEILKRRVAQAGLAHVHTHQFRHTWAADNKGAGMSDQQLERLAGWTPGSAMSRRYGAVVADEQARDTAFTLKRGDRV